MTLSTYLSTRRLELEIFWPWSEPGDIGEVIVLYCKKYAEEDILSKEWNFTVRSSEMNENECG